MGKIFTFTLSILFIFTIRSIQPPLWPQWFSQSMSAYFDDLNTTATYWYDSEVQAQRYDFQNGNTKTACGCVLPINTPCTHLIKDGWLFFVYPQKNLCCKLYEANPTPRDWLKNYTFRGQQTTTDAQVFNIWDENLDSQTFDSWFYIEANGEERPRRTTVGGKLYFDYWLNSFSNKKPKSSLFDIPSYCQGRCWDHFQNQKDYKELHQNLMQIHKGLSKNQKFEKFIFENQ